MFLGKVLYSTFSCLVVSGKHYKLYNILQKSNQTSIPRSGLCGKTGVCVYRFRRCHCSVGKRQRVLHVMKDNNLLKIRQIRDLEIATFVYKFMNKLLSLAFHHPFKIAFKTTKNTRSQSSLYPSFCRVHITKQAMRYKGPLI